jgi:hypothetical protein
MKIENINSRRLFGFVIPRAELVPEGIKFLAKVALTFLLPALAFSWVMSSTVLFEYLIAQQVLGVVCGLLLYKHPARRPVSCVPVHLNPNVPAKQMKKAA